MDMNLDKLWEMVRDRGPGMLQSVGSQRVGHNWATEQQHMHGLLRDTGSAVWLEKKQQ